MFKRCDFTFSLFTLRDEVTGSPLTAIAATPFYLSFPCPVSFNPGSKNTYLGTDEPFSAEYFVMWT